jgi:hypothetical protein
MAVPTPSASTVREPGRLGAALPRPVGYAHAGSVVNRAGVDCFSKGARLVASVATWIDAQRRYRVERAFYAVRAAALSMLPRLTERALVTIGGLARYPELAVELPFPAVRPSPAVPE